MISSEVELKELKSTFEHMDLNGDGILSKDEMSKGLDNLGYKDDNIEAVFSGIDMDDNGKIEYTEFLAGFMDHKKYD